MLSSFLIYFLILEEISENWKRDLFETLLLRSFLYPGVLKLYSDVPCLEFLIYFVLSPPSFPLFLPYPSPPSLQPPRLWPGAYFLLHIFSISLSFLLYCMKIFLILAFLFFLWDRVLLCHQAPGWSAVARFQLTETSASWVQGILLPQPPEYLGLQARAITPS